MAMKLMHATLIAGLLAAGVVSTLAATPAAAQGINARQNWQQWRIYQGVRTGALTPREYERLQRQQARIAAQEQRMRWSGGRLTPHERRILNRRLDRASAAIDRYKHNRLYR